jgi:release factor glutamine methyltransferase
MSIRPRFYPSDIPGQLRVATSILSASSDTPRLDAELLLAHALGVDRSALLLNPSQFAVPESYANLIARRLGQEPVAYIIGRQDFWTISLEVGPGVLIPRSDSEALIEAAVNHFGQTGPAHILDLGTGPGTLLLAALDQWPMATGVGVDASRLALDYAQDNAARLGMQGRVRWIEGDWDDGGQAQLILANPPYVETGALLDIQVRDHEPAEALFAGAEGLDAYRRLIPALVGRLLPGGIALIEIGATQADAVCQLACQAGFNNPDVGRDLAGRDRFVRLNAG